MKITLLAHHIEWNTDGDMDAARALPSKVEVEVDLLEGPAAGSINDQICNQLSDITGWCVLDSDFTLHMENAQSSTEIK